MGQPIKREDQFKSDFSVWFEDFYGNSLKTEKYIIIAHYYQERTTKHNTKKRISMGTRGAIGFFKNGNHKITYNHFDSYPSQLGTNILKYINCHTTDELNAAFNKITMVNTEGTPTKQQQKICKHITNLDVSDHSLDDWYCLLHAAQGNLEEYNNIGLMTDDHEFLYDSLFCEWAYIINLDNNILEIYQGLQKSKPKGRYTDIPPDNDNGYYYAVELISEIPLTECPVEFTDEDFKDEK